MIYKHLVGSRITAMCILFSFGLTSCGGGGGGSTTTPPIVTPSSSSSSSAAPIPTVTILIDSQKIGLGQTAKVQWKSTNSTSCSSKELGDNNLPVEGTQEVKPSAGGQYTYTVTCTGTGGNGKASTSLIVPMPVAPSSYENKMAGSTSFPNTGIPVAGFGIGFGDFFQEGKYSMVTQTMEYDLNNSATINQFGHIQFWQLNDAGKWTDNTSKILSNTLGCLHVRKAIIADFNNDKKPDIFLACHGFDAAPFPGEQPHILLSQSDGTYKNITMPFTCYCHGGSAADLNGDGLPDIVVADTTVFNMPYTLINNGDGTFTQDFTRLPLSMKNLGGIYSLELIDTGSGQYDLFLGSGSPEGSDPQHPNAPWAYPNGILKNDGDGKFLKTPIIALPNPAGSTGIVYGLALDFVYKDGYLYYQQINGDWDASNTAYSDIVIHRTKLSDMSSMTLFEHMGVFTGGGGTWFPWLRISSDNKLSALCDTNTEKYSDISKSTCGVEVPL